MNNFNNRFRFVYLNSRPDSDPEAAAETTKKIQKKDATPKEKAARATGQIGAHEFVIRKHKLTAVIEPVEGLINEIREEAGIPDKSRAILGGLPKQANVVHPPVSDAYTEEETLFPSREKPDTLAAEGEKDTPDGLGNHAVVALEEYSETEFSVQKGVEMQAAEDVLDRVTSIADDLKELSDQLQELGIDFSEQTKYLAQILDRADNTEVFTQELEDALEGAIRKVAPELRSFLDIEEFNDYLAKKGIEDEGAQKEWRELFGYWEPETISFKGD